jgi:hypothetical protein
MDDPLDLVRLHRIAPGIIPANQILYKLEKQSGSESFRSTNPTQTNRALGEVEGSGMDAFVCACVRVEMDPLGARG